MSELPPVDDDPDEWVEHDELVFSDEELAALVAEGNRQGIEIDPDDDEDAG